MADTVAEAIQQAAENITENANVKVPASPEGMALAYGSLVVMALLPIFFGSKRSVSHQKEQKESTEKPDIMTKKDAMMFPVSPGKAFINKLEILTAMQAMKIPVNPCMTSIRQRYLRNMKF